MIEIAQYVAAALLVLGGIFGLTGSYGLLRLKDPMQRLHAPTKASTVGVGAALIASAISHFLANGHLTWQELLVTIFLFVTAPLSALFLAKTHIFLTINRAELPDPDTGTPWATLDERPPVEQMVLARDHQDI
ncbi:MAG: monovalent cation/H(+) antiporter subunit G [Tabrizicola sp.]|nr:monovalent cation/H(+) antiporter subunit G [Tabrizicola sp.]